MATRFMTDPHAMRAMAGRFEVHAQTVEDEARRMWASSQNISGAGWSGLAEATSLDTMSQMNQAFRNIVNMLHGVRDGLIRDANKGDVVGHDEPDESGVSQHCEHAAWGAGRVDPRRE
ncbi:WXG100 family type VII secretion target [Mycobacterium lacus]|nr:WXG100 family type VII secretion target [Mycobacterium lacus]